ncbi:MAG: bifunctional diaminohydroxyphosphoribosylaminopyrimidine deaminase/5-amino-6-(5-phosphoribosylamino)uracil reductase RibD [bacterium]
MIENLMLLAIELAKKSFAKTLPNPRVGAVIFDDQGKVLGAGYHREYGKNHAEVEAINDAKRNGVNIKGANICVTLEPCSHTGKTPPCTDAIFNAGIKKVFIGARDDCKTVSGYGLEVLKQKGIEVVLGVLEKECRALNPGFHKFNQTGLPFVQLKAAMSLNGKMTNRSGANSWFTGEESRKKVHLMRAFSDLIITGVGTIKADNPSLNSRLGDVIIPNKIAILDPSLDLLDNYIKKDLKVLTSNDSVVVITKDLKQTKGFENDKLSFMDAEIDDKGMFVLPNLIKKLGLEYGVREIFIEAGPSLVNSFLKLDKDHLDKITLFIAPVWFNKDEHSLFTDTESSFPDIEITKTEQLGNTLCVEGRL